MSRPRLWLALLLVGAAALSLAQARAAGNAPAAVSAPTSDPTPTPTPGVSLDLSNIGVPDISGVWEVAHEEPNGQTTYTHFRFHQAGVNLTGEWLDAKGKAYPATGSLNGNTLKAQIDGPQGAIAVQAQLDPPANMIGLFVQPDGKRLIFTASNQAKYTPEPAESGGGEEKGLPH